MRQGMRRGWHGWLPYGMALSGTAVLALTALDVHAPLLRVPLCLVFLCLGPGLVLVHPLDLGEAYIVLTVAAALSLTLDKVVAAVKKDYPGKKIRIQGHTDKDPIVRSTDKWIDNMDLSQNRAGAVARYLMLKGVDMKSIVTVGFGDTQPKSTKAQSRRVEIVVVTD